MVLTDYNPQLVVCSRRTNRSRGCCARSLCHIILPPFFRSLDCLTRHSLHPYIYMSYDSFATTCHDPFYISNYYVLVGSLVSSLRAAVGIALLSFLHYYYHSFISDFRILCLSLALVLMGEVLVAVVSLSRSLHYQDICNTMQHVFISAHFFWILPRLLSLYGFYLFSEMLNHRGGAMEDLYYPGIADVIQCLCKPR